MKKNKEKRRRKTVCVLFQRLLGELVVGGIVPVAVGISDRRKVTCDTWQNPHQSRDSLSPVCGIFKLKLTTLNLYRTGTMYYLYKATNCLSQIQFFLKLKSPSTAATEKQRSVLLSASVERFFFSCMRDFYHAFSLCSLKIVFFSSQSCSMSRVQEHC